jgi:hypothetical protein
MAGLYLATSLAVVPPLMRTKMSHALKILAIQIAFFQGYILDRHRFYRRRAKRPNYNMVDTDVEDATPCCLT